MSDRCVIRRNLLLRAQSSLRWQTMRTRGTEERAKNRTIFYCPIAGNLRHKWSRLQLRFLKKCLGVSACLYLRILPNFFFFLKKVSSIRPTHKFHINTWLGRHILTCCLLLDILGSLSVLFPKSHKNSRVTTRCVLICFSPVSIKLVDETETKPKINSKFVQLTER